MTFKLFGTAERTYWKTIFESSTGANRWITVEAVENTVYRLWAVGGGGGGSNSWNDSTPSESACAGGGSGGYAYAVLDNTSGQSSGGDIQVYVGLGGTSAYTTGYYDNITAGSGEYSKIRFPKLSSSFTVYAYTYNGKTYYTDETNYPSDAYTLDSSGNVTDYGIIIVDSGDNDYICFSKTGTPRYTRDSTKDTTAKMIMPADALTGHYGTGGATGMDRYGTAGTGGSATVHTANFTFQQYTTTNGNAGTAFGSSYGTASGGASLYLGHGKGGSAGPAAAVESGTSGYVRIDKMSNASDYTYVEEKISDIRLYNDSGNMKGYNE